MRFVTQFAVKFHRAFPLPSQILPLFILLVFFPAGLPGQINKQTSIDSAGHASHPEVAALLTQLGNLRVIRQTALSPDGEQIAWVLDTAKGNTEIHLANLATPFTDRIISASQMRANCSEGSLAWAPSGRELAFLSDCQSPGQVEIFLADARNSGAARRLSDLQGFVDSLEWTPDGKSLGFLYVKNATRRAGALDAMKAPSGVIGEEGIEVQRIAALNIATKVFQFLTPPSLHVYEFDWSPDSHQVAYVAAAPPGENNWWIAQLYTQSVPWAAAATNTASPRSILNPNSPDSVLHGLQIAVPRWAPDGKQIVFIGGLMSDQGSTGGDIYTVPSSGGVARNLTPGRKSTTAWIGWRPQRLAAMAGPASTSQNLVLSSIESGEINIAEIDPATGVLTSNYNSLAASIGDGRLEASLSISNNGKIAYIKSSFSQPPEVFVGQMGAPAQPVTHVNDALKPAWGKAESITWTSTAPTGTFDVQGWLLYPEKYDPAKKYPMIVSVHGGPAATQLPRWPGLYFDATAFSALDYFVFFPNPRGSYGQGETFTRANVKDFGYGDLKDILAGVDAVVAKYPVDAKRIGLTGWSYGGFMTMFAVTQSDRFRAAVAGAGISNWQSYYGENSIDQWMIPYFGASVYDDPAVYAKSSAINFIHNVKTPTLVVVGDRDGECPAPQSYEFWHALRSQQVPTRLVVYADEGHRFVSPDHRRDVLERALDWFAEYMPAQP